MISVQEAKWLFWYTRNTSINDFAREIWDIENLDDSPNHEKQYVGVKFQDFVTFSLGSFDDGKIQRIIEMAYKSYGGERDE